MRDAAAKLKDVAVFVSSASNRGEVAAARAILTAVPGNTKTQFVPKHAPHGASALNADANPAGYKQEWAAVERFLAPLALDVLRVLAQPLIPAKAGIRVQRQPNGLRLSPACATSGVPTQMRTALARQQSSILAQRAGGQAALASAWRWPTGAARAGSAGGRSAYRA